jgi:acyl-CoA thioester hydrolase
MTDVVDAQQIPETLAGTATKIVVRFADVDLMQVVHHATYFHWFEQIRFSFLENVLEIDPDRLRRECVGCPVMSCDARFLRALAFGDRVTGYARAEPLPNATFRFQYWIYRDGDPVVLSATGSTRHCYVGANMRLLLRTPEFLSDAFARARARFPELFAVGEHDSGKRRSSI